MLSSASPCCKPKSRTSRERVNSRSSRRFMFSYSHSYVQLLLASLPIYQIACGASSPKSISPRFRSTDRRLPFTISFEPASCTLAPQPKHAENRSIKLLYPRLGNLKISFFSFCRTGKFNTSVGFIGAPSYTPLCYKHSHYGNFMRRAVKFNQIL